MGFDAALLQTDRGTVTHQAKVENSEGLSPQHFLLQMKYKRQRFFIAVSLLLVASCPCTANDFADKTVFVPNEN